MQDGHIINPAAEVGERALALCGWEFKVEFSADQIPDDHPVCRTCVNKAVTLLAETVGLLDVITAFTARTADRMQVITDEYDNSAAAQLMVEGDMFRLRNERKAAEKAAKKAEKKRRKKAVKKALAKQEQAKQEQEQDN